MSRRDEINSVLKLVEGWPIADRMELVRAILDTLTPETRKRFIALEGLIGIGRGVGPAPTDEQVKQWIDEHRMSKYG